MTAALMEDVLELPPLRVDVVESGSRAHKGTLRCAIDQNLEFSTASMESYFFAGWEPVLYDALLIAAAVEFCDMTRHRPARGWGRDIHLRIPVHEPERWNQGNVTNTLHEVLDFLTGDRWRVTFYARKKMQSPPRQVPFDLSGDVSAVMPFSDGLDSCAVAGLMARELGIRVVRIRLGVKDFKRNKHDHYRQPFTSIPYKVRKGEEGYAESSARSRGFKFALISGLAAYLSKASRIIVPESGQGALGPPLVTVGHAHADYRSHPLFTGRMEKFLAALLGYRVRYEFPQLWNTKGETLANYVSECEGDSTAWVETRSCWQQNRQIGVEGRARQCGVCAACMLRRLSVHAAGLTEPKVTYVWENLGADSFEAGAAVAFDRKKITGAMRDYAIAGVLHLDHLAGLHDSPANAGMLDQCAFQLGRSLGLRQTQAREKLDRLLTKHESEWESFMASLGSTSFVADWAMQTQR